MNVKPFYIKREDWMKDKQIQEVLDKAVKCGAKAKEGVRDHIQFHNYVTAHNPARWEYFGITFQGNTFFTDRASYFGRNAIQITIDQVDEHLGLTKPPAPKDKQSLVGTKIDLRKPDGSVDKELSAAFQEACFEQGVGWNGITVGSVDYNNIPFMYVSSYGLAIGYLYEQFKNDKNKQIKFNYTRKLEWEIEDMSEERKIVTICGVDYYEDELAEAVAALEAAKVDSDVTVTPQAGGGTPPDRPQQ